MLSKCSFFHLVFDIGQKRSEEYKCALKSRIWIFSLNFRPCSNLSFVSSHFFVTPILPPKKIHAFLVDKCPFKLLRPSVVEYRFFLSPYFFVSLKIQRSVGCFRATKRPWKSVRFRTRQSHVLQRGLDPCPIPWCQRPQIGAGPYKCLGEGSWWSARPKTKEWMTVIGYG